MSAIVNIGDYCLTIVGDTVAVTDVREPLYADERSWLVPSHTIKGIGKLIARKTIRYTLATLEDMKVLYIHDPEDDGWGYAINLTVPWFSEWGYAPRFR